MRSKEFVGFSLIAFLMFIIGIINKPNDIGNVYADLRAFVFLFFSILFFSNKYWNPKIRLSFIIKILVIVCLFDLLTLFLRPYFEQVHTKQTISILAPVLLSIYYMKINRLLYSFLFLMIGTFEAVIGFFRNYYLIMALCFLICFLLLSKKVFSNDVKIKRFSIIYISVIIICFQQITPFIYQYWTSNESRSIHSIDRSLDFYENQNSETERIGSISAVFWDPDKFMLPNGLGWRNYISDVTTDFKKYGVISSMDSCFFYLAYHCGIITLVIFLFLGIKFVVKSFLLNKRKELLFDTKIRGILLILFLFSFFTQASMLTTIQGAFSYGLIAALIKKPI